MELTQIMIARANVADSKALTHISKKAFDDDSKRFLLTEQGGPPGYLSEAVNSKMIRYNDYYKIRYSDFTTIGGIILAPNEEMCYIKRMFLDPKYQDQGIGQYVIAYIEKLYESVSEWNLDTPIENERTNHFYQKCGYQISKSAKGFHYYKKIIKR